MNRSCRGLVVVGFFAFGCGPLARQDRATVLPNTESRGYPAASDLEIVGVPASEWKQITSHTRTSPCDRRRKYVAGEELVVLKEAFRAATPHLDMEAQGSPSTGDVSWKSAIDLECSEDSIQLVLGKRTLDMDFVDASVESDVDGKLVRFAGFSASKMRFALGLVHTAEKKDRDGIVVASLGAYLPTQIGPSHLWRKEGRDELFVTGTGSAGKSGVYVVGPLWDDDQLRIAIAKFRVVRD